MKLFISLLQLFYFCSAEKANVHFFFRTAHPEADFHQKRLTAAKESVLTQAKAFSSQDRVFADGLEKREDYYSHFLVVNALPYVKERLKENTAWIFIGEETTRVELEFLLPYIDNLDKSNEPKIIGRPLFDQEITIIHHFFGSSGSEYKTFGFPDYEAGFLMNIPMMNALISHYSDWENDHNFNIDPKHEFMKFIKTHLNIELTPSKHFCGGNWHRSPKTCYTRSHKELPDCGLTEKEKLFVGVKTTEMFHKDRLKVVKRTWGPKFDNIIYYSNVTDPKIPTVRSGPNTERGHCQKLYHIMDAFLKMTGYDWLYVADDDTIVSAYRIHRLTACYNPEEPVFIGERYGYNLNKGHGYPYITGGGGMLFSRAAVEEWKKLGCKCPAPDTPDDMMIGLCFHCGYTDCD
jgi:UDP-glucose:O-linked fucose beta-1,3-glucosyltransferase